VPDPFVLEYTALMFPSHEELAQGLNDAAREGWNPVAYAIWPMDPMGDHATHFVILQRNPGEVAQYRQLHAENEL